MKEPMPKSDKSVVYDDYVFVTGEHTVYFWTDEDTAKNFLKFGHCFETMTKGKWCLTISPRYDFREVVEYIKNYG